MTTPTQIPLELQNLDDQSFLGKAYIALMGRPVDPTGFRDYMIRMGSGTTQEQVWRELSTSGEAQRHAARTRAGLAAGTTHVKSVADLLALEGSAFLQHAYAALLGRDVDATGLRDYGARLAAGESKARIIVDIYLDPEGQAYLARIEGLQDLVRHLQAFGSRKRRALDDLMQLHDDDFVRAAYRLCTGQEPRREVVLTHIACLSEGLSRMFVLKQIVANGGKNASRAIPGLECALKEYQRANRATLTGWYLRAVRGIESDVPSERRRRAVLYRLRQAGGVGVDARVSTP